MGRKQPPIEQRFWAKVQRGSDDKCWTWTGCKRAGYGVIGSNGRVQSTHRVSWILHYGEIPVGLFVCHTCDNPACVNPHHLFLGTHYDNMLDMKLKGRAVYVRGQRVGGHKLTEQQVLEIKALLNEGHMSQRKIGRLYGVSGRTISYINAGKKWKHIK